MQWSQANVTLQINELFAYAEKYAAAKEICLRKEFEIWRESSAKNGVLLYGAGGMGKVIHGFLQRMQVTVVGFVDTNDGKNGTRHVGVQVFNPQNVPMEWKLLPCIVSIDMSRRKPEYFQIVSILNQVGIVRTIHHDFLHRFMSLVGFDLVENFTLPAWEDALAARNDIVQLATLLADDYSRELYYKELRARLVDPGMPMDGWYVKKGHYFWDDIYRLASDDVVIDGGAYTGDTLADYISLYGDCFKEWHLYEPFEQNIETIQTYLNTMPNQTREKIFVHKGVLSNTDAEQFFLEPDGEPQGGTVVTSTEAEYQYALSVKGEISRTCSYMVDHAHQDDPPTFIKLDVEGAELAALEGAKNTLSKHRPILVASIYHKSKDLWEIPLWIHNVMPEARLFMRADHPVFDRDIYAIPPERVAIKI